MSQVSKNRAPSFSLGVRVYYEDTDAAGVVYYASYLRYLERARTEWLRALGFVQERLRNETGMAFVVTSLQIDYLKPARLDDALEVTCDVAWLGRAQIVFDQRVRRGVVELTRAQVRVACLALATMRPTALPDEIRERLLA